MNIVLYNPEIPQNTGNIARTCAATGAHLHLIEPLGFSLDDRYLKRSGLDYWWMMRMTRYASWDDFAQAHEGEPMYFASTKAPRDYAGAAYGPSDFLVFGCETKGLPEALLARNYERCVRIPMREGARSLNLANSVAVLLYEALRQQGFSGLVGEGSLTAQPQGAAWQDYI
jgi:tRNA (cytidine/uridine-2'-O-)-methyltransferase